jgi:excisionase family DNA binding protein
MPEELKQVADLITANIIGTTKEVLTSDEAAKYMGISKSYLYKLTMGQKIPHYKPTGKMCYFNRLELENWLQSNRVSTSDEIDQKAQAYCMKKGGRR